MILHLPHYYPLCSIWGPPVKGQKSLFSLIILESGNASFDRREVVLCGVEEGGLTEKGCEEKQEQVQIGHFKATFPTRQGQGAGHLRPPFLSNDQGREIFIITPPGLCGKLGGCPSDPDLQFQLVIWNSGINASILVFSLACRGLAQEPSPKQGLLYSYLTNFQLAQI